MTQHGTPLADIRSIPATGLRHVATTAVGDVEVTALPHPQAGYLVQVRVGGVMFRDLCSQHNGEAQALTAWKTQVAAHPAVAKVRTLTAPAKGTALAMSPAEVVVIGQALESTGTIRRGRGYAAADLKMLQAMARRGFVDLDHPIRPRSATVTELGRRLHAERTTTDQAALAAA
jgi:hypothetical protein